MAPPRDVLRGRPQSVAYDKYSVIIGGRRVLLWAGEFDYYRLPSPSLWLDRLQEMKAAGFNAVSIYFNWDYHSAAPGVYDFSGVRDINRLLNDAQRVGLYVIARPGPYINAETDAGGLAGWLASEPAGSRNPDPQYLSAADQWLSEVDPIIAAHQITRGGDVIMYQIENEYGYTNPQGEAYFGNLEAQAKADGIDVPTYTNDVGSYANGWAPGTPDAPDLIGSDQYPEGFDCSNPNVFNSPPVLTGDHEPGIPLMVPEYQGGSFDSWGGTGYPGCAAADRARLREHVLQGLHRPGGDDAEHLHGRRRDRLGVQPGAVHVHLLRLRLADLRARDAVVQVPGAQARRGDVTGAPGPDDDRPGHAADDLRADDVRGAQPGHRSDFPVPRQRRHAPVTTTLPTARPAVTVPSHEAKFLVSDARFGSQDLVSTTSELVTPDHARRGRDVALLDGDSGAAGQTVLSYAHRPAVRVLADPSGTPITWHWDRALAPADAALHPQRTGPGVDPLRPLAAGPVAGRRRHRGPVLGGAHRRRSAAGPGLLAGAHRRASAAREWR